MVSLGHARGASIPLHGFKKSPSLSSVAARGSTLPARAAVRLFRTREPTPKEYDSWARAPVSEIGLLFLAVEMMRRATAGGGSLFGRARRFAFSAPGV
jgi:hypothetical protein